MAKEMETIHVIKADTTWFASAFTNYINNEKDWPVYF
jgi:hypothetical protein